MSAINEIANEECKMEMTPMIDVTFLLLIFFMCTIKFKTLEGKLAAFLPKDVGVNPGMDESPEKIDVLIEVQSAGRKIQANAFAVNGAELPWTGAQDGDFMLRDHHVSYRVLRQQFGDSQADMEDIRSSLDHLHRIDPDRAVSLKPMPGVIYADVIPVLDILLEVGFQDVTFNGSFGKL